VNDKLLELVQRYGTARWQEGHHIDDLLHANCADSYYNKARAGGTTIKEQIASIFNAQQTVVDAARALCSSSTECFLATAELRRKHQKQLEELNHTLDALDNKLKEATAQPVNTTLTSQR